MGQGAQPATRSPAPLRFTLDWQAKLKANQFNIRLPLIHTLTLTHTHTYEQHLDSKDI